MSRHGSSESTGASVQWELGTAHSYGEYLQLDRLLNAQQPRSRQPDELMFIVVHQVAELWMRLLLEELAGVLECVRRDDLGPSFKRFARICGVQSQLLSGWEVLASLTPADYAAFRNALGRASGFQSHQYRLLEFQLGNKNAQMLAVHRGDRAVSARLERALRAPSLYDEALRLLSRRGYGIPDSILSREFSEPYAPSKPVAAAWLAVYHNAHKDWDLYQLAEHLIDLDYRFQLWRCHHLKTVERIIGHKPGTGGTGGVSYLAEALRLQLFPELWQIRNAM